MDNESLGNNLIDIFITIVLASIIFYIYKRSHSEHFEDTASISQTSPQISPQTTQQTTKQTNDTIFYIWLAITITCIIAIIGFNVWVSFKTFA